MLYTESGLKEYGCHLDFDPESVLDTYKWQVERCNMGLRPVGTAWHLPIFFAFCLFFFLLQLSSLVEYSGEYNRTECQVLRCPSRWIVGTSLGIQVGHKSDVYLIQYNFPRSQQTQSRRSQKSMIDRVSRVESGHENQYIEKK